jgi:hypothetical protein
MVVNMKSKKKDFIRTHLISKVFQLTNDKMKKTGVPVNSFVYFDNPIKCKMYDVDRFGKGNFYFKNQILPLSWSSIDYNILGNAFDQLKSNKVYVYRNINGKIYKTRSKDGE